MRLAAQLRGGYYPASPEAVAYAATFLRLPENQPFAILDPCAGEGAAFRQLGGLLNCPPAMQFAIELDDSRAETLRAALPESHVLAPASFFGCHASYNSFSFVWLNPPFDEGFGGHRVEDQFLQSATEWMMPGGVLALICPEDTADEASDVRQHFAAYYDQCRIVPFPEAHRRYREVIVFGHKRNRLRGDPWENIPWEDAQAPDGFVYRIPPGPGPRIFRKVEPTEAELQKLLAASPLRALLHTPPAMRLPSPPMALGIGHVALLLASGHLDGIVQPDGQAPHIVRGASRKREYVADVTETIDPDGSTVTKTTLTERIELVVRTVDVSGRLQTFHETDASEE
jgi:predicted RNA methylase